MSNWSGEAEAIMQERFSHDNVLALATVKDGAPWVRSVNAYYENGAFYVITYALSNKMRQIAENPAVALAGDWYTARGVGESMGYVGKRENQALTARLRQAFSSWIDNGHTNFADENTVILRIRVTEATLFSHGTRYDFPGE
ncbi:MAG: pyridoxamine 5'-phosphate oxidase family protein [Clostridiales bacterium]|nr:pyridoxamine 5'-phosphate oxidase family protein [Clostridiales bacterium]